MLLGAWSRESGPNATQMSSSIGAVHDRVCQVTLPGEWECGIMGYGTWDMGHGYLCW